MASTNTTTHKDEITVELGFSEALNESINALQKIGKVQSVQEKFGRIVASVKSGTWKNLMRADVTIKIESLGETKSKIFITASAQEGLISQNTANKAINRFLDSLLIDDNNSEQINDLLHKSQEDLLSQSSVDKTIQHNTDPYQLEDTDTNLRNDKQQENEHKEFADEDTKKTKKHKPKKRTDNNKFAKDIPDKKKSNFARTISVIVSLIILIVIVISVQSKINFKDEIDKIIYKKQKNSYDNNRSHEGTKIIKSIEIYDGLFLGTRAQDGLANIFTRKIDKGFFSTDTIRTYRLNNWYKIDYYDIKYDNHLVIKFPECEIKLASYDFSKISDALIRTKKDKRITMLRRAEKYNFNLRNASDNKKRSFLNGKWEGFLYVGIMYGSIVNYMYYAEFSGNFLKLYRKGPANIDELNKQSKELIYSGDYSFGRNTRGSSWLNSYIKIDDSQIVPIVFDGNDAILCLEKSNAKDNEEMLSLTEVKLVVQFGTAYVNMDKKTDYINMDTTTMAQHSISQKVTNDKATQQFKTVTIGNQIWMAENLNLDVGSGCWCYENKQANCNKYGRLYSWEAAKRAANKIEGWHLPTDNEWKQLERYLGMSKSDADDKGNRGNVGDKLKSTSGWFMSGNGNNSTSFSALPSGYCMTDGDDSRLMNSTAYFWTATIEYSIYAWYRQLDHYYSTVIRYSAHKDVMGCSVRLVKD